MNKILFIITCIGSLLIGILFRFYALGSIPDSLDWDEVSWGYNAYSILHTGKDEWGLSYPLSFRAFGDYKQPGYVYLSVPSIAVFGLSPFGTRFPSALFGSLSIIGMYLFVYELFKKRKEAPYIALASMVFFAVSPWSIQFSRVAFEATVGLCFVLFASWAFLRGVRMDKTWYLFISIFLFALSAYTYHSEKLFSPLFFVGLSLYAWKYFVQRKRFFVIIYIVFFLANVFWLVDAKSVARGESVLFTSQQTQLLQQSTKEIIYDKSHADALGVMLHNRRFVYASTFLENYLSHFDPNWLFVTGDLARHHAPGMGLLYIISLPLLLWGGFLLWAKFAQERLLIAGWLFFAPIASALAQGAPNAERALIVLPVFIIAESIAISDVLVRIQKKNVYYLLFFCFMFLYLINIIYYTHQYFVGTNRDDQTYWQYGYAQAMRIAYRYEQQGKRVFIGSDFEQPYIFYLFYNQYSPETYIQTGGSRRTLQKCFAIGEVYFGTCTNMIRSGDIYVTTTSQLPFPATKVSDVLYANGSEAVGIYRKK